MKKIRRTLVTVTTERLLVMSHKKSLYGLCDMCGDEVRLLTVDDATLQARVNSREIYRSVEAGELHFVETTEGGLLVCSNSLNTLTLNQKDGELENEKL